MDKLCTRSKLLYFDKEYSTTNFVWQCYVITKINKFSFKEFILLGNSNTLRTPYTIQNWEPLLRKMAHELIQSPNTIQTFQSIRMITA